MGPLEKNLNYDYLKNQILPIVSTGHFSNVLDKSPDLKRELYDNLSLNQLKKLHKEASDHPTTGTAADAITNKYINIMVELVIGHKKDNDREKLKYTGIESMLLGNYQGFYPGYSEDLIRLSLDDVVKKIRSKTS